MGPPPYPEICGLVVFYEFDGNLENSVADEHHGSASRAITYVEDRHGTAGSAVHVVSDTIWVADHSDLDITGEITLAAWIRPELSTHAYNAVIDKNYDEAYSLGISGAEVADTVGADRRSLLRRPLQRRDRPSGDLQQGAVAFGGE